MTNKNRVRRQAGPRPVNPGQHELQITNRIMENAIVRARSAEAQLEELRLLLAGTILAAGGTVILEDQAMTELGFYTGFDTHRDEEVGALVLTLVPIEAEDEEEEADEDPT